MGTILGKCVKMFDGWLAVKVVMIVVTGMVVNGWCHIPRTAATTVSSFVLSIACCGLMLCFLGVILTITANEVRVPLTSQSVRDGTYLWGVALLVPAQVAWILGIAVLSIWPALHPELMTATTVV